MILDRESGLVDVASQLSSPNFNERPDPDDIGLVVVHGISLPRAEFGGSHIVDLFLNRIDAEAHPSFRSLEGVRVSAHFIIRRTGELLQFVPVTKRAWHAGKSSFNGRIDCNDYSIGIELEGADDIPYEQVQYQRLATLIRCMLDAYPDLDVDHIVGHSDIAPGRKTDPGPAFDWPLLRSLLGADKNARREKDL